MKEVQFECFHLGFCHTARRAQVGNLEHNLDLVASDRFLVVAVDNLAVGRQDPEDTLETGIPNPVDRLTAGD